MRLQCAFFAAEAKIWVFTEAAAFKRFVLLRRKPFFVRNEKQEWKKWKCCGTVYINRLYDGSAYNNIKRWSNANLREVVAIFNSSVFFFGWLSVIPIGLLAVALASQPTQIWSLSSHCKNAFIISPSVRAQTCLSGSCNSETTMVAAKNCS